MSSPDDPRFTGPMQLVFDRYDPADERRRESLFGLGNGVLFVRACPPEAEIGDAQHYPGTYRAGCYNRRSLKLDGQQLGHDSLVNLPNWLPLSFRVRGKENWFSPCHCDILAYTHTLDMARGITERCMLVRGATGWRIRMREQRLVSMTRPMITALRLELTPENWSGRIELRTALDGEVVNGNTEPSLSGYRHLDVIALGNEGETLTLEARTRQSGVGVALAARTHFDAPVLYTVTRKNVSIAAEFACDATAGRPLAVEKVAAIVTARDPVTGEPAESARTALADAPEFAALREEHATAWRRIWDRVGIEAENPEVASGCAFHIFHLLQTISPHSTQIDVGLPPRGWQEAYHGQIFWDEIFSFAFLNHRFPEIARSLLLYRYRRLPQARRAARKAGHAGAMFPWRSATTGEEETPCFQFNPLSRHWIRDDTRLQRHIGAAIAHNVWHYWLSTGDDSFLAEYGAELLVEIARFWASIAVHEPRDDRFDIRSVIGPDEYHNAYPGADASGLDNNAYTNVMAATSLLRACTALDRLSPRRRRELAHALAIGDEECTRWRHIASRLRLCFFDDGVISQFQGYDQLRRINAHSFSEQHPGGRIDWVLEARGDTVDAYQVSKQPDVLMLLYLFPPDELIALIHSMGYDIDHDRLRRTIACYLERITHESSLSQVVCAGALAPFDREASWRFFQHALCIDFDVDNSLSAGEGLHLGAMAGTLDVLQRHFLGLRVNEDGIHLLPDPPPALGAVRMRVIHRSLDFTLDWDGAALHLRAAPANAGPLPVRHAGGSCLVGAGEVFTVTPRT